MTEYPVLLNHDENKLEGIIKLKDSWAELLALGVADLSPSYHIAGDGSITLRALSIIAKQNYIKEQ